MAISAAEASRLTGRSKQAVIHAIHTGKISAVKDIDGAWQIEPVELFRYYQPLSNGNGSGHQTFDSQVDAVLREDDAILQVEIKLLRQRLADKEDALHAANDVLRTANDQIVDLRRRLDEMTATVSQLAAVIAQLAPPQPRKGWWQRLLGGQ